MDQVAHLWPKFVYETPTQSSTLQLHHANVSLASLHLTKQTIFSPARPYAKSTKPSTLQRTNAFLFVLSTTTTTLPHTVAFIVAV